MHVHVYMYAAGGSGLGMRLSPHLHTYYITQSHACICAGIFLVVWGLLENVNQLHHLVTVALKVSPQDQMPQSLSSNRQFSSSDPQSSGSNLQSSSSSFQSQVLSSGSNIIHPPYVHHWLFVYTSDYL